MAAQPMPEVMSSERLSSAPAGPMQISLEEYLHTAFHPDCDFVDGVVEERTKDLPELFAALDQHPS